MMQYSNNTFPGILPLINLCSPLHLWVSRQDKNTLYIKFLLIQVNEGPSLENYSVQEKELHSLLVYTGIDSEGAPVIYMHCGSGPSNHVIKDCNAIASH